MGGWMDVKAVYRIANNNKKVDYILREKFNICDQKFIKNGRKS